jgi:hypothetical protein
MSEVVALNNLKPIADQLGRLKIQMAELAEQEARLIEELQNAGVEILEGNLFRVTISTIPESQRPNWKAIAQKLNPSRQLIAAHQTTVAEHRRVTVNVRKGDV